MSPNESRLEEAFSRIRDLEMKQVVFTERQNRTVEVIEEFKDIFAKHDKTEMAKYDKIDHRLNSQSKLIYIGFGAVLAIELLAPYIN